MVDVTTDGERAVMIGIGVAGVALFLVARVIGLVIQRGSRGMACLPLLILLTDAWRPAKTECKESIGGW